MGRTCPHCGCSEIDEDTARGDATCTGCGTVLEESIVVSENQFQERAGGSGHTLVGQFVSMDRSTTHTLQGVPGLTSQESREVTFQKGRKLIEEIASQLRINQHCIETAYNFFKMCVSRGLTRGRIRTHVVASCMYMTCRLENTSHLLLDFSDVTQVNVFDLGRTLSFLSRSLRINLPTTDPCLYIMRFACMLEFGDKQKEVVNLATRLVQRMKRDWMSTGRRPTGLCGAALLIAARAFNFNRSIPDVVRIVHISESVVRKRLEEFGQTPSGALTIDEFAIVDLEHDEDPPAYQESKKKVREQLMRNESLLAEKLQPVEEEIEKALEKKRREKFKHTPYAKIVAGAIDDPDVGQAEERLVRNDIIDSVFEAADEVTSDKDDSQYAQFRPTLESLGIASSSSGVSTRMKYCDVPNGELELDDIDDDEIDTYILSSAEASLKEKFWMKSNGEHLKEMERRKREREEQEETGKDAGVKKKRRSTANRNPGFYTPANTAVEAMEKIIHEKKLSNKVNYDILKEIEHTSVPGTSMPVKPETLPSTPVKRKATENIDSSSSADILAGVTHSPDLSKRERDIKRRNTVNSSLTNLLDVETVLKTEVVTTEKATPKPEEKKVFTPPISLPLTRGRLTRSRRLINAAPNIGKTQTEK
ncbi:unnamed protein product [Auanema sp. JU1783]|nr:unnamed protein product [Auanema sp. JU1783]